MKELVRTSQQQRSRETQERILNATARLLRSNTFESISIRRIVQEAEASIGSFYARFRDKDALLPVLYAQSEEKLAEQIAQLERAMADAGSLADAAELIADHLVARYGDNPHLSRALFEYATREPDAREAEELSLQRMGQYGFLFEALKRFEKEITHPNPSRAVELGLYFVAVTGRTRLFYPRLPQARTLKISRAELKTELARLLLGYLTC